MNTQHTLPLLVAAGLLGASFPILAAKHTWTGAARVETWSAAGNWVEGPPVIGEDDIELAFPPTLGHHIARNDIGTFTVRHITFSGDGYVMTGISGKNLIRIQPYSRGIYAGVGLIATAGTNHVLMAVEPQSDLTIRVSGPDTTLWVRALNHPDNDAATDVTKTGNGTLVFDGNAHNIYHGTTTVTDGLLRLVKDPGVVAIPGDLIVGTKALPNAATVRQEASNQIVDTAAVAVGTGAQWQLNGFDERITRLAIDTGLVTTKANNAATVGTLEFADANVAFDISAAAPLNGNAVAELRGRVSLRGITRHVIAEGGQFQFTAQIVNPAAAGGDPLAGMVVTGPGELWLGGGSTYDGPTLLENARTVISEPLSLGSAAGATTVKNGATLILNGNQLANGGLKTNKFEGEALILADDLPAAGPAPKLANYVNAEWAGTVTVIGTPVVEVNGTVLAPNTPALIDLQGPVSGEGGLSKTGFGRLQFSGKSANTYTKPTFVVRGELRLHKSNPQGILTPIAIPGDLYIGSGNGEARVTSDHGGHIADASNVVLLDADAQLLATGPETLHSISGSGGLVQSIGADLIIDQTLGNPTWNNVSYKGYLYPGEGTQIRKRGEGRLFLETPFVQNLQVFFNAGPIHLEQGAFCVNGNLPNDVLVTGGTLAGKGGRAYGVEVLGGEIRPGFDGSDVPNPVFGELMVSSLRITREATFVASLVTPSNHGKLTVASLFGPGKNQIELAHLAFSPAPQPANGDVYVLIDPMAGVPTTGNFLSLAQGASVPLGNKSAKISYNHGPNHNAVTLTVPQPIIIVPGVFKIAFPEPVIDLGGRVRQFEFETIDPQFIGRRFRAEFSRSLEPDAAWSPLAEVEPDAEGRLLIVDSNSSQDTARFYRVIEVLP